MKKYSRLSSAAVAIGAFGDNVENNPWIIY